MFDLPYCVTSMGSWPGNRRSWLPVLFSPVQLLLDTRRDVCLDAMSIQDLLPASKGLINVLKMLCVNCYKRFSKPLRTWMLALSFLAHLNLSYLQDPSNFFRIDQNKSWCFFLLVWKVFAVCGTDRHGKGKRIAKPGG